MPGYHAHNLLHLINHCAQPSTVYVLTDADSIMADTVAEKISFSILGRGVLFKEAI